MTRPSSLLQRYRWHLILTVLTVMTCIKLTAPIAWWLGPPDTSQLQKFEGKLYIPYRGFKPSAVGSTVELKTNNGSTERIHCGFLVAKQDCFFFYNAVHYERTVDIVVFYHWYWGVLSFDAKANSRYDRFISYEQMMDFHFKEKDRYTGLGGWFLLAGVLATALFVLLFVILPTRLFSKE